MTSNEWIKLCKNIYERRCILFIGSEFPIENRKQDPVVETNFSDLLSEKLKEELSCFQIKTIFNDCIERMELSQVATDYLKCCAEPIPRQELESVIENYLDEMTPNLSSPVFKSLMQLPFSFIVDTNFTNFFATEISSVQNKIAQHSFYHFRKPKANPDNVSTDDGEKIGTEAHPYVYNIYGSTEVTQSIAISENELIEWLTNVISHNPKIPTNIKNLLQDSNNCFLFIGFGFASKDWFFRILLHTLGSVNKQLTSYATQSLNTNNNSSVVFFKVGLKVGIYPYDNHQMFVTDLIENYKKYEKKETDNNKDIKVVEGAPTAFILYTYGCASVPIFSPSSVETLSGFAFGFLK